MSDYILLTGCIKPKNQTLPTGVKENYDKLELKRRFYQYAGALEKYNKSKYKVIFIDNSDYDLTEFEEIFPHIIFHKCENADKHTGELLMMSKACAFIGQDDYVIKMTGRLFMPDSQYKNAFDILHASNFICGDKDLKANRLSTWFIGMKGNFYNELFRNFLLINEINNLYHNYNCNLTEDLIGRICNDHDWLKRFVVFKSYYDFGPVNVGLEKHWWYYFEKP